MRHLKRLRGVLRRQPSGVGDDWNEWWRDAFDGYAMLPDEVHNAIELGCGPYTNIRLIRERCSIQHVVCSDPLACEYLRLKHTWLAKHQSASWLAVDSNPIESIPFKDGSFDLVILINVLDHVRDARLCIKRSLAIAREGAFLVIGQDLTNHQDMLRVGYDRGHPIRVRREELDERLTSIKPIFHKVLARDAGRNPAAHYGTYLLVGRKY
jgi:SAM-dependent methyltransferase